MTRTFALRIGNLNNLSFLIGAISPAGELSIVFLLMKKNPNVASAGLGGVVVGGAR
jgi:hypothetical protein